jgi:N4-gp56 family major capsid protein
MPAQTLATQQARIARFKGEILKHVMPQEVLGRIGASVKKTVPKNVSETIVFRRWLPKGATANTPNTWSVDPAAHRLSEGETPNSDTMIAQDITVSLVEYGVLYRYSNRVADLYEDDVPPEMKRLTGERMGLLLEMIRWGQLRAGTNVFYPTTAITSRSSVGGAASQLVSANAFRRIARSLSANLASKITSILSASAGVGTSPVEAAFIAVCSTDLEADFRSQLTGFIHVSEYGSRKPVHENELGSWEQYRFVTSPHLGPYLLQGGTFGTANTYLANGVPNTGSNASDVYPILVMSEECYGDVMLRGMDSFNVTNIPSSTKTKDDPLGQRGYVGAQMYFNAVRLNEGQMAILEVPASAL